MNFGSLFGALGIAAIKSEAQAAARKLGRRLAFGVATGILAAAAVGFAVAAFTVWLADELGTIWALLVVAAILVALAILVQVIGSSLERRPPAARAYRPPPITPLAGVAPAADDVPPGSEIGAMAVVAALGFLLARQLFRRR